MSWLVTEQTLGEQDDAKNCFSRANNDGCCRLV